jgi:hypothetical protein
MYKYTKPGILGMLRGGKRKGKNGKDKIYSSGGAGEELGG